MVAIKKYDLSGKEMGTVDVDDAHLTVKAHSQSMKDYLVAIRKNARQWSAHTKTRAEIARTGRKPHPQKGQGRSRQGDLAAPQYKGGGIVFGPRKKEGIHVRINQKERRAAVRFLLAEKIKAGQVYVLTQEEMKAPKTKTLALFFDQLTLADRRVLILGGKQMRDNLMKSVRNLPKKEFGFVPQMNGYTLAKCPHLVVLESAFDEFLSVLGVS